MSLRRAALVLWSVSWVISVAGGEAWAAQQRKIELASGTEMTVVEFPSDGKRLVLWFPAWRGLGDSYAEVAENLAAGGFTVWALDLHDTYLVPKEKSSFDEFSAADLVELIEYAAAAGWQRILIAASGLGAPLALDVGRQWQVRNPGATQLKGFVFVHPQLTSRTPGMGEQAEYLPIARATNLPVYLLQPQYSTKYLHSAEIATALGVGGSPVFMHNLPGVQGGFHMRAAEDLREPDHAVRFRIADLYDWFLRVSEFYPYPRAAAPLAEEGGAARRERVVRDPTLHPYRGNPSPPPLAVTDLQGNSFDLRQTSGKVVLVNFWATWCGPCVREIPSLQRLYNRLAGKGLEVLAVNIGEPRERIVEFLRERPVEFPVLLDEAGSSVRGWRVYAYPSNFLIDANGRITHAYRGALEWDAPEVVGTIEAVLARVPPSQR